MQTLLIFPEKRKEMQAVKAVLKALNVRFEEKDEDVYDPEFVAKIEEGRREIAEGKGVKMDIKSLWK